MRYVVRKSVIHVLGTIWMPSVTAGQELTLTDYDLNNARDDDGKLTRESVARWLDMHAGDFAGITDFWASLEDGENTVEIPWKSEDSEPEFNGSVHSDDE